MMEDENSNGNLLTLSPRLSGEIRQRRWCLSMAFARLLIMVIRTNNSVRIVLGAVMPACKRDNVECVK